MILDKDAKAIQQKKDSLFNTMLNLLDIHKQNN